MLQEVTMSEVNIDWQNYHSGHFYDELITSPGQARPETRQLAQYLASLTGQELQERKLSAEIAIKTMGISFTVYSDAGNIDREWPFDIIPRIIPQREWKKTERGLIQRLRALNLFINDIYNDQKIIKDRMVPAYLFEDSVNFCRECIGMKPAYVVWSHVCGSDLIRDDKGEFFVLEDNLRVPSGVSYMLENRKVTKRVFPELFENHNIVPVTDYPNRLFDRLASLSPRKADCPEIVVLTPGDFPRAVAHCLQQLEQCLWALPNSEKALSAIVHIQHKLDAADVDELLKTGLHEYIDELQLEIGNLHFKIAETWLLPVVMAQAQEQNRLNFPGSTA